MTGGGVSGLILTQGGETPGRAGVTAALATGFAAAALTHAGPGDSTAGWRSVATDRQTDRRQTDR